MKAKSILALLLLYSLPFALGAQDLLVTQSDDSIKCRISSVYDELIEFKHLQNGRWVRAQLAKAAVKSYRINYYYVPKEEKHWLKLPPRPRWSVGCGVGYAYRNRRVSGFSLPELFDEHMQGLRGGRFIDFDIAYYLRKGHGLGIGLRVTDFSAYNKSRFEFYWGGISRSDDVYIRNLGLFLSKRFVSSSQRHELGLRLGGGLSIYNDYKIEAGAGKELFDLTYMAFCDVAYNYVVIKNLGIGPSLSWFVSLPGKADDLRVGHLAIDLTLRYNF